MLNRRLCLVCFFKLTFCIIYPFFVSRMIIMVWFLAESVMSHRIIGAVLIVAGLYFVLWGKSEERKFAREQLAIASTTDHSIIRPASHAKASLAQPLLSSSTENVWTRKLNFIYTLLVTTATTTLCQQALCVFQLHLFFLFFIHQNAFE